MIDQAVRQLYADGYLHNHARLWLASYLVHVRKIHWRSGADWLYGHLLDGDLASNHLSWQWVAGTGSSKPYLFNADNVEKFAPTLWHSRGSVIDISYEAMAALAKDARAHVEPTREQPGIEEPPLRHQPVFGTGWQAVDPVLVKGRDVWLVHPWALRMPSADAPANCLRIGVAIDEFHQRWPWSADRWHFVGAAMDAITEQRWFLGVDKLASVLQQARSVRTVADPHIDALLDPLAERLPAPQLFPEVADPCRSFSSWWKRATRDISAVSELPGMLDDHA